MAAVKRAGCLKLFNALGQRMQLAVGARAVTGFGIHHDDDISCPLIWRFVRPGVHSAALYDDRARLGKRLLFAIVEDQSEFSRYWSWTSPTEKRVWFEMGQLSEAIVRLRGTKRGRSRGGRTQNHVVNRVGSMLKGDFSEMSCSWLDF